MRRFAFLACALVAFGVGVRAQPADNLALLLEGLAQRTQQYYDRFVSIICTETVERRELRSNLVPIGPPRVTVYELSVSRDPREKSGARFRVERLLQSVNGRPARKNQSAECADPKTGTPEPLEFLLASKQSRYRFTLVDDAGEGPGGARAIDFIETPPERVRIKWEGHCFEAEGGGHQGRIWFDPVTYDVLQVKTRLSRPFFVPLPNGLLGVQPAIRVEKSEETLRFSRVEFQEPDEAIVLPASIETVHLLRGLPSMRIHQRLSNYRRFLTKSEIRTGGP